MGIEVHRPDADDAVARLIPALKEEVNVEYASPSHYLPELPSWEGRSRFIARHGSVEFLHYDFHAQALAKAVRNKGQYTAVTPAQLVRTR